MQGCSGRERVFDWLWFLAWAVASSVWCVTAASQLSATFDEPIYLTRGLECWRTGSHAGLMQLGTMPLPVDAVTLPLYLWERGHGVRLDPAAEMERVLPWARAGTLAFWWLLLLYGRAAGRRLAGPWGGRLAVALLACEPNLLAHAGLATTDVAVAACLFALVYHFRAGRDAGWLRRVGWPTLWFAAAVLAKASGLVFGPLCLVAVEVERWWANRRGPGTQYSVLSTQYSVLATARDVAQIFGVGLVLVFLYCGTDWKPQASWVAWAHSLPDTAFGRGMVWLSEHLCVFSNAGEGILRQVKHNVRGHGVYLLGRTHPHSLWYYFPVVLTIKLTLPLLAAPLVVAAARGRALLNWACLAALALLLFSVACRVQIGVRFMLPLIALAVVGLAGAAVRACRDLGPGWRSKLLAGVSATGVAWAAAAAVLVWPHGLCYVNELWGGTRTGYLCLSDANYDWGQGLKELTRWQRRHADAPLDVWYFGSDPAVERPPLRHLPLHALPLQGPDDVLARVRGHYLAVSTTLRYGMTGDTPGHQAALTFLEAHQPAARTTTFLIYDFTHEPAADETKGPGPLVGTGPGE